MRNIKHKFCSGVTMIELVVTTAIGIILVSAVGVLLISGSRGWQQTYDSAHKKIKEDADAVTVAFGSIGRKSNRLGYSNHLGYIIYKINGTTFTPAVPAQMVGESIASGNAVEFRYWDVELDKTDSHHLMDVTKTATAYALFYLEGNQLKLDYGLYPPGGVPDGGGHKNTPTSTTVLAENVSTDPGIGAFSHSTLNGAGEGSVRIDITLTDPDDGETLKLMTATLMRNIWPR
ncbi:MAG: hypothetical protein WAK60_05400 [Sedimentisphaerales bacterium]